MDQLSSCYFCGGALDVSLSEYPVVPTELRMEGEDSKTVVLCTTCRKKLATVVEEVVDATEGGVGTDETAASDEFEPTETSSDDGTGFDFVAADDESTAEETGTSVDETADEDDSGGLLGGGSTDRTASDETAANRTTTASGGTADDSGTEGASGSTESTAADDDATDSPSLTRLEYNKVMRLLQNREFPVDKAEIREVATSAYQISPDEFDAVIDAAIERDLIAERNGQFVSAE